MLLSELCTQPDPVPMQYHILLFYCLGLFEQSLYHANEGLDAIDSLLPVDKNSTKVLHAHAGCLCILGEIQIHKGQYPLD